MNLKIKQVFYRLRYGSKWMIKYAESIGVKLDEDTYMSSLPEFDTEPYLISIGRHVLLASQVRFVTHEGAHWVLKGLDPNRFNDTFGYGKITINDNVYIGTRTTILRGVTIGNNVIVGACSLVNKSLEDNSVYAGIPARKICSLEEWKEKFIEDMPEYDRENYKKHKKEEVLRIVDKFHKR